LQSAAQGSDIFLVKSFCDVEASDFRDADSVWIQSNSFDLIASADFPFAGDGEVEAAAAAGEESSDHIVGLKPYAKFVTRKAWLRHNYFRGANGETIAEMDFVFVQTLCGEVFSKDRSGKFLSGQFLFPIIVVLDGVAVDGFLRAAVDGEVSLTVAVQIQSAQTDASLHRFFENAGGYRLAVPEHVAR